MKKQQRLAIAIHGASAKIGMPALGEDRFDLKTKAATHCANHFLEMAAAVTDAPAASRCSELRMCARRRHAPRLIPVSATKIRSRVRWARC